MFRQDPNKEARPTKVITLGGTRTPNLRFRRPTPYPLGHAGIDTKSVQLGFSYHAKHTARLAQSVEHETLNLRVVGSSPTLGASFCCFEKAASCYQSFFTGAEHQFGAMA